MDHTRRTTAARRGGIASERRAAAARSESRAQGKQALWLVRRRQGAAAARGLALLTINASLFVNG